jgi:putative transposase
MISTPDRQNVVQLIAVARAEGARLEPACAVVGITIRTHQRWTRGGHIREDQRPMVKGTNPANALPVEGTQEIQEACHRPEHARLPPDQIAVRLLDEEGTYIASESNFYRVLRSANEQPHRGRAATPRTLGPPPRHVAVGPTQVWSHDVTYLPTHLWGAFLYLYLVIDVFSRKIVGNEVFDAENALQSSLVIERAVLREQRALRPLTLHADEGSPMKGSALRVTLDRLGVTSSHCRPRVSNSNDFSEALFHPCKYGPDYPVDGFNRKPGAQAWVHTFVQWYNRGVDHAHFLHRKKIWP